MQSFGSMQSYLRPTDAEAPSGHFQAGLRPGNVQESLASRAVPHACLERPFNRNVSKMTSRKTSFLRPSRSLCFTALRSFAALLHTHRSFAAKKTMAVDGCCDLCSGVARLRCGLGRWLEGWLGGRLEGSAAAHQPARGGEGAAAAGAGQAEERDAVQPAPAQGEREHTNSS